MSWPGSLLQLSAWVKSQLSDDGRITIQIYCMSDDDKIVAQPSSRPIRGRNDWTPARVHAVVPEQTAWGDGGPGGGAAREEGGGEE